MPHQMHKFDIIMLGIGTFWGGYLNNEYHKGKIVVKSFIEENNKLQKNKYCILL